MTEIRHCPQCGAELPSDAPEGVCPKCVLGLGFRSSPGDASNSDQIHSSETMPPSGKQAGQGPGSASAAEPGPAGTGTYHAPFTAPTPQELAKHFPHVEIIELLGQGGMGAVYKAREPALDRLVAVKIMPPEAGRDPAFAERFHREARALAKLNHPNIVAVYGIGQAEGLYYFIMEFVDGVNLRQLIRSGLQPEQALKIVPQICEALQFAHDEGIVHRDIKPENILLDKRGRLKIADFGLARLLGGPRTDYTLTGPRQVMGTPNYMAPEQMDDPLKVDHRADIYSLGVVFYEMLTGELPRGRFEPPSKKVQVDVRLDEVVLRALEQQPERRYQHASEVKTDVENISGSAPPIPESSKGLTTAVHAQPAPLADSGPAAQPGKFRLATLFWFLLGIVLFAVAGFVIDKNAGGSPGTKFIHGAIGFWLIAGIGGWLGELIRWRMAGSSPATQAEKQAEKFRLATLFWFLLGTVLFAIAGFMSDKTAGGSPGLDLIIGFWLIAGIGGWLGELIRWRLLEQRLSERGKSRRALEQQPERRYQQASEVKTDVETISRTQQPPSAGPLVALISPPDVDVEAARDQVRGPAVGLLIAGIIQCAATVFLFFIAIAAWFTGFSQEQRVSDNRAPKVQRSVLVESHEPVRPGRSGKVGQPGSGD